MLENIKALFVLTIILALLEGWFLNLLSAIFLWFSGWLLHANNIEDIILNINLALITILIPVAIAIFGDKKEFEALDKNVILDYVVAAKSILSYLALIFLPLFFWYVSPLLWFRFIGLAFWLIGIYLIIKILIHSYNWLKGNKYILRFKYLRGLEDLSDLEENWRSVWQTQNISAENEREFYKIFVGKINNILNNHDSK